LVYDDGASFGSAETARAARAALAQLDAPAQTPWLAFGGIPAPYAGLFETTGALSAITSPNSPSLGQSFSALPADLKPPVPVTNLAQYGYALNVGSSPGSLIAAQAHLGAGVSSVTIDGYHGWNRAGALTPITRFATMFSGYGLQGVDGVEWSFPERLTDDTAAVDNGLANAAQKVLDVHATMGRRLPHDLLMYAFGAALGGSAVPAASPRPTSVLVAAAVAVASASVGPGRRSRRRPWGVVEPVQRAGEDRRGSVVAHVRGRDREVDRAAAGRAAHREDRTHRALNRAE
jgi:hypothetical protein